MRITRAAIYTRVSTKEQGEGFSLATQVEACRQKALALDATVVMELQDLYTGTSMDRPEMARLRALVEQKVVDYIIVYDEDRISRDMTDTLVFDRLCQEQGVALIFVQFDRQNTPEGHLFFQIRGSMAQFEHALIKERTRRGKAKKAASGKLTAYAKPYGYDYSSSQSTLVINTDEAQVVQWVFQWLAWERLSLRAICDRLTARGIMAPKGSTWHAASLRRIVRNPTYVGRITRRTEQPEWQPLLVPALIEPDLWQRAQQVLNQRRRLPTAQRPTFLLQGLMLCQCGRRLKSRMAHTTNRQGHRYMNGYYYCPGRRDSPACPQPMLNARVVDTRIWEEILTRIAQPEGYEAHLCKSQAAWEARRQREFDRLQRGIQKIEGMRQRIQAAYYEGIIEKPEFLRQLEQCRQRRETLAQALSALPAPTFSPRAVALQCVQLAREADGPTRQALARILIERIEVQPDRMRVLTRLAPVPVCRA